MGRKFIFLLASGILFLVLSLSFVAAHPYGPGGHHYYGYSSYYGYGPYVLPPPYYQYYWPRCIGCSYTFGSYYRPYYWSYW